MFFISFGILPRRGPITLVVGAPIEVAKIVHPNQDDIDKIHTLFCNRLEELFEKHKGKYIEDSDEIHLEFV